MVFKFFIKIFTKPVKTFYLIFYSIKVGIRNSQSHNLIADGKFQEALDKIDWIDNEELYGRIGLRKVSIYYWLGRHQNAINIANKLVPYFKKTKHYNKYDQDYLVFCAKFKSFRNYEKMNIEQPKLLSEIAHSMGGLNLSKIDKRLMKEFPERSLKGWYKHNPKDEHYEETIARYGEE